MKTMLLCQLTLALIFSALAQEKIGQRPYEMDWANRTQEAPPPLVDFENLQGWTVTTKNAAAEFRLSREQQLWGAGVGKLVYRTTNAAGQVSITPPAPIAITNGFDSVTLWVYGNNWGYARDTSTPPVTVTAWFSDHSGKDLLVDLHSVNWKEWFLLHRRLTPEQIQAVAGGAQFRGIQVRGIKNTQDRVLYFDNFAVGTESFSPLTFESRPQRGIPMFPGQSAGLNNGPGQLPFPTRRETILPVNLVTNYQTELAAAGAGWTFRYAGSDGIVEYQYTPKSGTWSDLTATFRPAMANRARATRFQPCSGGGVYLWANGKAVPPEKCEHLGTRKVESSVESRWKVSAGTVSAEVIYAFRLWQKSLVLDVRAAGGPVAEVRYGRLTGETVRQLVTNPYYLAQGGRPAVVVMGTDDSPLFCAGNTDWYLSNASILWAANAQDKDGAQYNGGTRYLPKTDGNRNDCFERFFITVTPHYEETLPTVANPVSPWKHITGTKLWRAHGASNREADARHWTECHRYGMTEVIVTDHETGWRDGGESFTFRTRPAPGKGGDQGQYEYARLMQDKLGFVYGPYNNFTDFAPVNEYWQTERVIRNPDNQLQHAWMRCYSPKPSRAVEFCAKLAPIIQQKFHFSTAYCDVHTCVAPWEREDYDIRVPGAGTFISTLYAYGEIMLLQKQAWQGPVYSEGSHHFFYCGMVDGNYGQDQRYGLDVNPWLVDFDLRQLHNLSCNFGMGNPGMFYGKEEFKATSKAGRDRWLDRFLTGTVAFGHPGFLVYEGGVQNALRSYYMLQQLHRRYCLTNAVEIRYVTSDGRLLPTTQAVATQTHKRSQVVVRYADDTWTVANGHPTERLRAVVDGRQVDLPPNGYCGWNRAASLEVISSDDNSHQRSDYADTPAYLYADGRGTFTRHTKAASDGIAICRRLPAGQFEIIPYGKTECGFAIPAGTALALDKERKELGPATIRWSRGLAYVQPVTNAFSYLVTPGQAPAVALACERDILVPGEIITIRGQQPHTLTAPTNARARQRLWQPYEGQWIDFTVAPLAGEEVELQDDSLIITLTSNLKSAQPFHISALGQNRTVTLPPRTPIQVTIPCPIPTEERNEPFTVILQSGIFAQTNEYARRVSRAMVSLRPMPEIGGKGICLRGGKETTDFGDSGGQVAPQRTTECGHVAKPGVFMHPPYKAGTGYAFARYQPIQLPVAPAAAFRAVVGKADGSDPGDGILYQIIVVTADGRQTMVAETTVTRHEWVPIAADLTRWQGQTISLQLVADAGPRNNSSGDWAAWAEMRLESAEPQWRHSLIPE